MVSDTVIKFKEGDHSYTMGDEPFTGCNSLLSAFGFYFDSNFWLVYGAFKNNIKEFSKQYYFPSGYNFKDKQPNGDKEDELQMFIDDFEYLLDDIGKDLGEETAKVQDSWTESAEKGTLFHLSQEVKTAIPKEGFPNGSCINPFDGKEYATIPAPKPPEGYDVVSVEDLADLEDGFHSELLVFLRDYKWCGLADDVFIETVDGIRYADVGDHKTNKKKPTLRTDIGTCFMPIEHIPDCTFLKFTLQLSCYAYALQLAGYTIRNLAFYWYRKYDEKTRKVVPLNYLAGESEDILNWHQEFFMK